MTIKGPKQRARYADLPLDCQMALEAEFQDLAERGEKAGWSRSDVAEALLELAQNHILAMRERGKEDDAILKARK